MHRYVFQRVKTVGFITIPRSITMLQFIRPPIDYGDIVHDKAFTEFIHVKME